MICRLRVARVALSVVFAACCVVGCAEAQDYNHDERQYAESKCHHKRARNLDYLLLPGFSGARSILPLAIIPNDVTVTVFHLDRDLRMGHVSIQLSVAEPGSHAYVGIYDDHGDLLVQGKIPTDVVGPLSVEVNRTLLRPGNYYFAIGAEGTAAQAVGYLYDNGLVSLSHGGLAANQIADGSLPAKLGRVTPPIDGSTPSAVITP